MNRTLLLARERLQVVTGQGTEHIPGVKPRHIGSPTPASGGRAQPGELLVEATTVETWSGDGVRFEPAGPASLKGIADPVELWRAESAQRQVRRGLGKQPS